MPASVTTASAQRQETREREALKTKAENMLRSDPSYAVACETLETLKSIDATLKRIAGIKAAPAARGGGG